MHRRVLLLLCLGACNSAVQPAVDAGWDSHPRDARLPADTAPPIPTVDFAVVNCPDLDVQKGVCQGTAPFEVQFVAIASSGITSFRWDFDDGPTTPTIDDPAPSHTFDLPGTYDITLSGLPSASTGKVSNKRSGFIKVLPNPAGSPCLRDEQCASGTCLCSTAKPCGHGPVNGLCSTFCQKASCPDDQVCVNLVTTASTTRSEPWQTQVCLPACDGDRDCSPGSTCRSLPAWPNAATRVKGCFVDVPAEMGHSCSDESSGLRNDFCLSGLCADMGALGLCSRDCSSDSCPTGSECALFGDGRALCLVPCSPTFKCDADPLLLCVPPSQTGFRIPSPSKTGLAYCAPKLCTANSDCGGSGICMQESGGGHCVSRYR